MQRSKSVFGRSSSTSHQADGRRACFFQFLHDGSARSKQADNVAVEKLLRVFVLFEVGVHVRETETESEFVSTLLAQQFSEWAHRRTQRNGVDLRVRKISAQIGE